jgi:hypothetical protein
MIRNLDFIPFFRFCQTLGKPSKAADVTGHRVQFAFEAKFARRDHELTQATG